MRKKEWHEIAQCQQIQGEKLLKILQTKWEKNNRYQFRFNVPCVQVLGISTEYEILHLAAFSSGVLASLEMQERKEN